MIRSTPTMTAMMMTTMSETRSRFTASRRRAARKNVPVGWALLPVSVSRQKSGRARVPILHRGMTIPAARLRTGTSITGGIALLIEVIQMPSLVLHPCSGSAPTLWKLSLRLSARNAREPTRTRKRTGWKGVSVVTRTVCFHELQRSSSEVNRAWRRGTVLCGVWLRRGRGQGWFERSRST